MKMKRRKRTKQLKKRNLNYSVIITIIVLCDNFYGKLITCHSRSHFSILAMCIIIIIMNVYITSAPFIKKIIIDKISTSVGLAQARSNWLRSAHGLLKP